MVVQLPELRRISQIACEFNRVVPAAIFGNINVYGQQAWRAESGDKGA